MTKKPRNLKNKLKLTKLRNMLNQIRVEFRRS